jgi:group II intron reverse transcriptase/maturase
MEQRKSYKDAKGKAQAGQTPVRPNTDALYDGGLSRSSEEASVMGEERRAEVIQLELPLTTTDNRGRIRGAETKSIPITKQMVWESYKKVRSNRGSAGIDEETLEMYEERHSDNLYILWNRMSSGSYFPSSVLEVEIAKNKREKRKLGIPTVNDRIAQQVLKSYLEPRLEAEFSDNSYGYRPLKNAHQAVAQVRRNVRKYSWVIDMDIASFFDKMSHELLMKALERHVEEKWVMMYIGRCMKSAIEDRSGKKRYRKGEGTPQGGVISPLLSNLFLHYAFDKWFGIKYPTLCFVRYADDLVVHCNSQQEAEEVLASIKKRLEECKLQLNETKTKIVFCKNANRKGRFSTVKFDFLGFSFQPRPTSTNDGKMFLGYDCSISIKSEKKIAEKLRKSNFHRWTESDITRIAKEFNPKIQGWINYYGKFRKYNLMRIFRLFNWRLIKWAVNRYKRFRNSMYKAGRWIRQIAKCYPGIFVHWQHGFQTA